MGVRKRKCVCVRVRKREKERGMEREGKKNVGCQKFGGKQKRRAEMFVTECHELSEESRADYLPNDDSLNDSRVIMILIGAVTYIFLGLVS